MLSTRRRSWVVSIRTLGLMSNCFGRNTTGTVKNYKGVGKKAFWCAVFLKERWAMVLQAQDGNKELLWKSWVPEKIKSTLKCEAGEGDHRNQIQAWDCSMMWVTGKKWHQESWSGQDRHTLMPREMYVLLWKGMSGLWILIPLKANPRPKMSEL